MGAGPAAARAGISDLASPVLALRGTVTRWTVERVSPHSGTGFTSESGGATGEHALRETQRRGARERKDRNS